MKKLTLCLTLLVLGLSDLFLLPSRHLPERSHHVKAAATEQAEGSAKAGSTDAISVNGLIGAKPEAGQSAPAQNGGANEPIPLDEHIRGWIAMLSKQSAFSEWKDAEWETFPLGPGTHSWVVLLKKNGSEIGYLIVTSDKEGNLSLTEYGTGNKPLFSMQTLYQSMMQREIIANYTLTEFAAEPLLEKERYYFGPLESFWKVTLRHDTFYFDAKTGERMPRLEELAEKQEAESAAYGGLTGSLAEVNEQTAVTAFDPNDRAAWIQGNPLSLSTIDDLKRELAQTGELTYRAKLLAGQATYPLAVTGYTVFSNGIAFLAVDHDGDRYVPYREMAAKGHFFH
ncbi:hypothetical protein [Paenibacillus sp. MBLB4367]|uniref:hypothetical protein n=1 Tax=Paenibacillus sp. MBLB4367 TaxID=3384767 RepID=UPI003907EF62